MGLTLGGGVMTETCYSHDLYLFTMPILKYSDFSGASINKGGSRWFICVIPLPMYSVGPP